MVKKLYPYGKKKAFNITYDDGVTQDIRFVELLNRYGIKGTFNLNSQLMAEEFEWIHPNGFAVKRLPVETVVELYKNHEVASHTLTHPYMHDMSEGEIMYQLGHDKYMLSQIFGREISGFAVPFSFYSDLIADCAQRLGFEYARKSDESLSYMPSCDWYHWKTGIFHLNAQFKQFAENFFAAEEELAFLQIVGHSYDLDAENMWGYMENLLCRIAGDDDILSMTNIEIVRYLKAMQSAEISDGYIRNNSDTELWFENDGKIISVRPYETVYK
ncbi:MAG: polysaccharide deacetylase family protein [Oscillospiraceae bacterium]|nr:polysaccharide deacetylase family protein [Oscillospiraceae bacterium]